MNSNYTSDSIICACGLVSFLSILSYMVIILQKYAHSIIHVGENGSKVTGCEFAFSNPLFTRMFISDLLFLCAYYHQGRRTSSQTSLRTLSWSSKVLLKCLCTLGNRSCYFISFCWVFLCPRIRIQTKWLRYVLKGEFLNYVRLFFINQVI